MQKTILLGILIALILLGCKKEESTEFKQPNNTQEFNYDSKIKFRGANTTLSINTELDKEDVERWASWNINLIRVNFNKDNMLDVYADAPTTENVWNPYIENLDKLSSWLFWLDESRIAVMISLDILYGDDHETGVFWDNNGENEYLNHRLKLAEAMAEWIKDYPNVLFLEVWNEPYPHDMIYEDKFLPEVISGIRNVNQAVEIVVMPPGDWGPMETFSMWDGVSDRSVIYSTHIYDPYTYTHQGLGMPELVEGWPGCFVPFPEMTDTICYNIDSVHSYLQIATEFKERTGARIMITEFGVVRWANQPENYIHDLIEAFEIADVDWIFHSLADWNGWNPTFEPNASENNNPYGGFESQTLIELKKRWNFNNKQSRYYLY